MKRRIASLIGLGLGMLAGFIAFNILTRWECACSKYTAILTVGTGLFAAGTVYFTWGKD
jgi:hypothetical protein